MYEASLLALLAITLLWRIMPPLESPQCVTQEGVSMPMPDEPKEWEKHLQFKGGGDAPDPDPDIKNAALKLGELGQEAYDFYKMMFQEGTARQDQIDEVAKAAAGLALESAQDSKARSDALWGFYKDEYMPVQQQLISDAMNWDSAENQAAAAGQAKADVNTATAQQQAATARQQQAMGVDPTSGAYQSIESQADTQAALNAADAQNAARTQKQKEGVQMRSGVANQGLQTANLGNQTANLGLNAGQSAVGTLTGANQGFYQNAALGGTGFNMAMKGYGGMGNMLNSLYQSQLAGYGAESANNAGMMSGLGSFVGGAAAFFSSKEVKEDKKKVDGTLPALNQLDVESWKYKDGVEDGQHHIGPYAEDWKRVMGTGDGKSIPVVDAVGVTMRAVQELDSKIDKLVEARHG